jgi:hypothetical protein
MGAHGVMVGSNERNCIDGTSSMGLTIRPKRKSADA